MIPRMNLGLKMVTLDTLRLLRRDGSEEINSMSLVIVASHLNLILLTDQMITYLFMEPIQRALGQVELIGQQVELLNSFQIPIHLTY